MANLFHSRFPVMCETPEIPVRQSGVLIEPARHSAITFLNTVANKKSNTAYALSHAIDGFHRAPT